MIKDPGDENNNSSQDKTAFMARKDGKDVQDTNPEGMECDQSTNTESSTSSSSSSPSDSFSSESDPGSNTEEI